MEDRIFYDMFITYNDDKTKAFVNIRPNSRIDPDDLETSIKEGFSKIKASLKISGINYGVISDREIIENLKKYCLMDERERKSDIYSFLIAEGTPPKNGEDSVLIEHVKLRKEKHGIIDEKTGNIDHKNLGFSERIIPENAKILTVVKPTNGEPGMDVFGMPIEPVPGKMVHDVKYDKNTIYTEETPTEINFFSKKAGFIYKDDKKGYFVDERVLTKAVDYKIGNIDVDDLEGSTVLVDGSKSVHEDSVKAGFKVEATSVKIKGNVGIEAEIKGNSIEIDGVVQKDAVVEGVNVKVNKFYGKILKGEQVYVNEVSNAEVVSKILIINTCFSSKVSGSEVLITKEVRGSEIIADKFVFINRLCGAVKQRIEIDPFLFPEKRLRLKNLEKERKNLKDEYEILVSGELEISEKLIPLEKKIDEIIPRYFKFSPDTEEKQRRVVKELFKKGEWDVLENKFNFKFKPDDVYYLKQYARLYEKELDVKKRKEELEKKIAEINTEINEMKNAVDRAVILIKELKDCIVEIVIDDKVFKITDEFSEPFFITFKKGKFKINSFSKDTKKVLSEYLEGFLTGDSFKFLRKFRAI